MPETTEPARQYDADMGEVTTQDPDGTVIRVEPPVPTLASVCDKAQRAGYCRAILDAMDTVREHLPASEERLRLIVALAAMGVKASGA